MAPTKSELGDRARALVRATDRGALATAMVGDGWPYASLVLIACTHDASPLLLISTLAEHTKNALADSRVGLLIDGTAGLDSPLTGARISLVGRLERDENPAHTARYVARHPDAADYVGFGDFALYRLAVQRAHLVAGFGAIHWIDGPDYAFDTAQTGDLAAAEADIVAHMNEDHGDAVQLYATGLLGLDGDGWTLTGVDPEGCDLRRGGTIARLPFEQVVNGPEEARAALVSLVRKARKTAAG